MGPSTSPAPARPEETSPSAFDFRGFFNALVQQRWLVLGTVAVVSVLVVFWTLRQPKIYEATCSIEYDPNPPQPLRGRVDDVVADPVTSFWTTKEFYKTQNSILKSRMLAERVVRKLGLHKNPGFMEVDPDERRSWKGVSVPTAAMVLQSRLTVEQQPDSRIVAIRVRDQSPQRAAQIANTVADTFIDKQLEDRLGTTVSALEWLSTQLDGLRKRLNESENKLHEFKQEHNILSVSLEDKQNIVSGTIEQVNQALTETARRRIELTSRLAQLKEANQQDPLKVHVTLIGQDLAIQALRAKYREKVGEKEALAERYGPQHPNMRAVDAELATLRDEMRGAIDGLISSVENDLNEVRMTEAGLRQTLESANRDGLELNLREIEYSRLNRERENNASLYKVLMERTAETNLAKLVRLANARVVDRALKPNEPVSPRLVASVAVGLLGGLLLGLVFAVVRLRMDRRLRSGSDVEAYGVTVLGLLPQIGESRRPGLVPSARSRKRRPVGGTQGDKDLIAHHEPHSAVAECCRAIRTNITFMSPDDPIRTIVVTSPLPREGKTTVAVSLAITMAQSGKRVLLVDTDLRRPRVHRVFGLPSVVGITSVLIGESKLDQAIQATEVEGLSVLPCGPIPPNPSELLHTTSFTHLIADVREMFDMVIFDSPPLGAVIDAAVIAPQIQGAVMVLRAGSTTRDALRSSSRQLRDVGSNILGAVLNGVDLPDPSYGKGYYYYYYYRGEGNPPPTEAAAAAE